MACTRSKNEDGDKCHNSHDGATGPSRVAETGADVGMVNLARALATTESKPSTATS